MSAQAPSSTPSVNIATYLPQMAQLQPYTRAVVFPAGRDKAGRALTSQLTFAQLDRMSNRIASSFEKKGIKRGTKTILMVRPSIEFFALTFGLFKIGAVPVMVDPGMGIKRMLECYKSTQPEAFVGIPLAHVVRVVFGGSFRSVETVVTVGKRWFWGGETLDGLLAQGSDTYEMAPTDSEELAAILFTTGSTGPAKGVMYSHGIFDEQVRYLSEVFGIQPGEIDVPTFPLFALFGPALGMTAIIPEMDPTRPAHVDPTKIIEAVENHGATNMFGSPALLNRVGRYGKEHGVKLPTLKRVISAGAPVTHAIMETFKTMIPNAQIFTPYGATEALPVCVIGSDELLSETKEASARGDGTCVGKPVPGHTLHIIKISDEPIPTWSDELLVPDGEVGEIVVKGSVITKEYFNLPEATAKAKIHDGETLFHRMGDLGWRDEKGRVWFCGRKSHRVRTAEKTMFTVPCESIFNQHPAVYRSALVGVGEPGQQTPVILIELEADQKHLAGEGLAQELFALGAESEHSAPVAHLMFHSGFPVDIRHNAKIFREKLTVWAAPKLSRAHTRRGSLPSKASTAGQGEQA